MKLYYAKGACSLSPHIALIESGLSYELEPVNLKVVPHVTASGQDYLTINSKGAVPALLMPNNQVLTEGAVILQYIADQVPDKKLAPPNGTLERYRLQEWLNFIATEIHKGFGPFFNPTSTPEQKDAAWAKLAKQLAWINTQLAGKDYLMGSFTVADCYLFTCLGWVGFTGHSLDEWPNIQTVMNNMKARPAAQQALKEEGAL